MSGGLAWFVDIKQRPAPPVAPQGVTFEAIYGVFDHDEPAFEFARSADGPGRHRCGRALQQFLDQHGAIWKRLVLDVVFNDIRLGLDVVQTSRPMTADVHIRFGHRPGAEKHPSRPEVLGQRDVPVTVHQFVVGGCERQPSVAVRMRRNAKKERCKEYQTTHMRDYCRSVAR